MQLGKDYKDDLHLKISRCDFMLVLIGPEWERILVDRKDSVFEDPVVYEIKTALELQIQIVPVLVISNPDKGVHTLSPNQLPQSIRAFEPIHRIKLRSGDDNERDLDKLINLLDLKYAEKRRFLRWLYELFRAPQPRSKAAIQSITAPQNLVANQTKPLKLLIIMGRGVEYEKALVAGLKNRLSTELPTRGYHLGILMERYHEFNFLEHGEHEAAHIWKKSIDLVKDACNDEQVDYVVSVATTASKVVRNSRLVEALGARGQIYMGVTSPRNSGLIGQSGIAGVQYGTGGRDYAMMFHDLFQPEQRLVFLYNDIDDCPQDRVVAAQLNALNAELAPLSNGRPRFELRPLGRRMTPADLDLANPDDPLNSPVYMAWYDLDDLYSKMISDADPLLKDPRLWLIPTTFATATINTAGLIVGVDDKTGGETAADIILRALDNPSLRLEDIAMADHGYAAVIKQKVLNAKGIRLKPEIMNQTQTGLAYRFV